MPIRTTTYITLFTFVGYLYGCYSITSIEISADNLKKLQESEITTVISKDSEVYEFERNVYQPKPQIVDSTIIGWIQTNLADDSLVTEEVQLPLSNIKTIYYEKNNTELVIGIIVGILGVGALVYAVSYFLKHSKVNPPIHYSLSK